MYSLVDKLLVDTAVFSMCLVCCCQKVERTQNAEEEFSRAKLCKSGQLVQLGDSLKGREPGQSPLKPSPVPTLS